MQLNRDSIWKRNGSLGIAKPPLEVEEKFWNEYKSSPEVAIKNYYDSQIQSDYVKLEASKKNIIFKHNSKYGELDITINLSKPEKDPKEIAAAAKNAEASIQNESSPICNLCIENEGFNDGIHENMRIIKIEQMNWYFQYSPYIYYNEHSIVLNSSHTPMKIEKATFEKLLLLLDIFPSYFFGSNSDIPIVGGSILTHDHFQGGKNEFPLNRAKPVYQLKSSEFLDVDAQYLFWPLSTIRLRSKNKQQLIDSAARILENWKEYSDSSLGILNFTNGERHNAITPISRKLGDVYELDLVLRNNRTTAEFPLGIFHPHPEFHYIKKENIGLIEVSGLAILPPRLKDELEKGNLTEKEIGGVFEKVLENCGVFKADEIGNKGFEKFASFAGFEVSEVANNCEIEI